MASSSAPAMTLPARSRAMPAARLLRSPVGLVGAVIVAAVVFVAIFAPVLAPHDPNLKDARLRLKPPTWEQGGVPGYWLGTDTLGRDILSRIIHGARVSVSVGVAAVAIAGAIGVTLGLVSGYYGGFIDTVLMRCADAFLAIPSLLLAILAIGVLGPGVNTLIIVLGVTRWVTYGRVVRGETLAVKQRDFVQAAGALGQSHLWIVARHILPNVAGSIVVVGTLNVANVILAEASLSFLGVGVPPTIPTWGGMLSEGRNYLATAWWLSTFPGIAISVTVLGMIFLGDWLRDVLDPRLGR